MKRKANRAPKNSGPILVFVGIFFIALAIFIKFRSDRVLSFSAPIESEVSISRKSIPVEISIESVGINLAVSEGVIKNGIWEISKVGATHLSSSKNPEEGGNIVIYAHNKSNLFGKLPKVKAGDLVKLKNQNAESFTYVVSETAVVDPTRIDYVSQKSEEVLTLYTCVGFMDTKRFVVVAKPTQN